MSQKEVEALWRDSKLSWADFLPETVDGNNFITEQKSVCCLKSQLHPLQ
ncbi:eukaryotic translation initiation factor 4 gamma 3 isoform X4, partial [Silurus asotus]